MTRLFDSTQIKAYPAGYTSKTDPVAEYKLSDKRERDMMWMKYRDLRQFFDEIEKAQTNGKLNGIPYHTILNQPRH